MAGDVAQAGQQRRRRGRDGGGFEEDPGLGLLDDLGGAFAAAGQMRQSTPARARGELVVDERDDRVGTQMVGSPDRARGTEREVPPAVGHPVSSRTGPATTAPSTPFNASVALPSLPPARGPAVRPVRWTERRSSEARNAARPRWIRLRTVPSLTPRVAPISS